MNSPDLLNTPKSDHHLRRVYKDYAFDYNRCSETDLYKFITARNLAVPVETTRDGLIKLPTAADRDSSFRLMDLAGELRNAVYEDLLTFQTTFEWIPITGPESSGSHHRPEVEEAVQQEWEMGHKFCFPQILAACKKVNKEASRILYEVNSPRIHLTREGLMFQGLMDGYYNVPDSRPGTLCFRQWPPHLLQLRSVTIVTDEKVWPTTLGRHTFFSLSCLLQTSKVLKNVVIELRAFEQFKVESETFMTRFDPLGRLCANFDCHFDCPPNEEISSKESRGKDVAHSALYKSNPLVNIELLEQELRCLTPLVELLPPSIQARKREMEWFLRTIHSRQYRDSLKAELALAAKLAKVNGFLDDILATYDFNDKQSFVLSWREKSKLLAFEEAEKQRQEYLHDLC